MTKPANILLVEDERTDIILTLGSFREARMANTINVATSGEEALDYLKGNGKFANREDFPMPDLILLDIKMPGIDGFEVLKQVKSNKKIKQIPIVILSSSKDEGDRAMALDMGASAYLVKPISFSSFLNIIKEVGEYWVVLNVSPMK